MINAFSALRFDGGAPGDEQGAATGVATIPTLSGGLKPKFVTVTSGVFAGVHEVVFGNSAGITVAGTGFHLAVAAGENVIVDVSGYSHYAWNRVSAATENLYITPLANGGGVG